MRVIKKLNNNFAICVDNEGETCIAYGKGIGFPKTPYRGHSLILDISSLNEVYRLHNIRFAQ